MASTSSLALKAQFGALTVFVCTILLEAGCGHSHASAFVAVHRPVKSENWRLYVNVSAPTADMSGTNGTGVEVPVSVRELRKVPML